MNWGTWLKTWEAHSQLRSFRDRVARAVESAQEGAAIGKMFGALSGGKDGCALVAVLYAAGLADSIPLVHCHTELNTPGMDECALATAEHFDFDLEVIEPAEDVWDLLRRLPREISIMDETNHRRMRNAIASGNMLVAHLYEREYRGSFTGMRSEESKGRRWNRKMRGQLYQLKSDHTWICQPIVDWSARDVFAMLVSSGAPIHPHYRLMLERFGVPPESPQSRVDCMIPEDRVTTWPVGLQVRTLYPELWRRMVAARPELHRFGG